MVGLLGDAPAYFEGDDDLDLEGEEMRLEMGLLGPFEAAVGTGTFQNSDSFRNFGSSTFLFGGISKCVN